MPDPMPGQTPDQSPPGQIEENELSPDEDIPLIMSDLLQGYYDGKLSIPQISQGPLSIWEYKPGIYFAAMYDRQAGLRNFGIRFTGGQCRILATYTGDIETYDPALRIGEEGEGLSKVRTFHDLKLKNESEVKMDDPIFESGAGDYNEPSIVLLKVEPDQEIMVEGFDSMDVSSDRYKSTTIKLGVPRMEKENLAVLDQDSMKQDRIEIEEIKEPWEKKMRRLIVEWQNDEGKAIHSSLKELLERNAESFEQKDWDNLAYLVLDQCEKLPVVTEKSTLKVVILPLEINGNLLYAAIDGRGPEVPQGIGMYKVMIEGPVEIKGRFEAQDLCFPDTVIFQPKGIVKIRGGDGYKGDPVVIPPPSQDEESDL